MDKIRNWIYESNQRKSKGGLIFMICCGAALLGLWAWMFMQ